MEAYSLTDLWTILRLMQDSYRAGANLPPLRKVCPFCREVLDSDEKHECPEEDTSDWPDDHKTDDPKHNQAKHINRENGR